MALVCLDTHFLIWGIKEECTPGQEAMIPQTKIFFRYLDEQSTRVIIPSIALFEFLMPVPPDRHAQLVKEVTSKFMVSPLDAIASSMAAEIWYKKKASGVIKSLLADSKSVRNKLKADCGIIGTAVTRKASCIYSYDDDLTKLAEGFIQVREVPRLQEQMALPGTQLGRVLPNEIGR